MCFVLSDVSCSVSAKLASTCSFQPQASSVEPLPLPLRLLPSCRPDKSPTQPHQLGPPKLLFPQPGTGKALLWPNLPLSTFMLLNELFNFILVSDMLLGFSQSEYQDY